MPSEIENNNLYADSNSLTDGLVVNGDFSKASDNDFFKINALAGNTITVDFDWKSSNTYNFSALDYFPQKISIEVFDPSTNLIARKYPLAYADVSNINTPSGAINAQKITFSTGAKITGPYYINLSTTIPNIEAVSSGYTITVNSETSAQMYETEPNEHTSSVNILTPGQSIIGHLSSGSDVDLYKIEIPKFKRSGVDGEATITVSDYQNMAVGSKVEIILSNGTTINLIADTVGSQSASNRSGNNIYFRPNESNNTTADNIYTALNSQSEFTISNPEANVVKITESTASPNTYLTLSTSDTARLAVTSPKGYPDVATVEFESTALQHLKISDANGAILKLDKSEGSLVEKFTLGVGHPTSATFDILNSGDYFITIQKDFGAIQKDVDYKLKVSFAQDQPNQENITLNANFATATDLGKISDLDEKWITFGPNGASRGFFKIENDLTFENYDRLFLRILGDTNDNYGVRFYDTSGANLSSWLATANGQINFGIKSQHQAKTGEIYYSTNHSVVEIYETTGKIITANVGMIAQHSAPKFLTPINSLLSDLGQYTIPTGSQIYVGESLYSLINSDGIKLSISKAAPVVIEFKQDLSKVFEINSLSDVKKVSSVSFLFRGFDVENAKKVNIKAYDKTTGAILNIEDSKPFEDSGFNDTGGTQLVSNYASGSNNIIVELTTEEINVINGWLLADPLSASLPSTTTHGNTHPDLVVSNANDIGYFASSGPDGVNAYGDNNSIYGWTGNDYLQSGESSVASYTGTEFKLNDDLAISPYTGNDIIEIDRNLGNFDLGYYGIQYPHEALEIGYDKIQEKYLVKGETFTDWVNFNYAVNNFTVGVGANDIETQPVTISSGDHPFWVGSFLAGFSSSPDLWETGRVPDKLIGHANSDDMLGIASTKSDLSKFHDLSITSNSSNTGLIANASLSNGTSKTIVEFSDVETLFVQGGDNNINLALDTTAVFSGSGKDIISSSYSPDFISSGGGDDTITLGTQNEWGPDSEAWNISSNKTIFYKTPIAGKFKHEDIIAGGDGSDTLNFSGAIFLHDVISKSTQSNLLNYAGVDSYAVKKARISSIETINGTGTDDVIDLTSPDFSDTFHITINGQAGHDVLWGNKGDDQLNGGDGDDLLFGGEGQDHLTGGIGKDVFEFASETLTNTPPHDVIADYNKSQGDLIRFYVQTNDTQNLSISGTNELTWQTSTGNQTIHLNGVTLSSLSDVNTEFVVVPTEKADRYVLHDSTNGWSLANLVGTKENDTLTGSSAIDKIVAGQGDDIITGGGGKDIIYAGPGDDKVTIGSTGGSSAFSLINGGSGTDTLFITSDTDANGDLINLDISHESGTINLLKGFEVIDISQSSNGAKLTLGRSTISKMDIETNPIAYSQYSNEKNVLVVRGGPNKDQKLDIVGPIYKTSAWTKHGGNNNIYTTFDGSESYYLILEHLTLV